MGDLIYRTSLSEPGPWLLGEDELKALDRLLDEQWERLNLAREQSLQQEIELKTQERLTWRSRFGNLQEGDAESVRKDEELQVRRRDVRERHLTIIFRDGVELSVSSFREAMQHPHVLREPPTTFHLSMRCGDVTCTVSPGETDLELEVSPQNSQLAWDLFVAVRGWVRSVRPPAWQQWWTRLGGLLPMLWGLWIMATFVTLAIVNDQAGKAQYKRQAEELLKKGLSPNEETKAIELILAFSADRFPQVPPWRVPGWFWFFAVGGTFSLLALSFRPNVILGMGKGEPRLRRWRRYLRLVFYTVPAYLFGNFAWPYLATGVKKLFQGP